MSKGESIRERIARLKKKDAPKKPKEKKEDK